MPTQTSTAHSSPVQTPPTLADAPSVATLERYAAQPTPRYTSYPTANHFSDAVDGDRYASWLAAIDPAAPVSLYLHVPFCRKICWYCACTMKLAAREGPIAAYAEALRAEIDLIADHAPGRLRAAHVHWGGGTPTALSEEDLEATFRRLAARFDIVAGAEHAIETDPRTFTTSMAALLGRIGVTRASLGVQEFDPTVQRAINRVQPYERVAETVADLRANGVDALNFDLMYGLPHQTAAALIETVKRSAGLAPNRVALFGYAHVPWVANGQRKIPEEALPGPAERADQAAAAEEALVAEGFIAIGLDHFARPDDPLTGAAAEGRLRRNFQGYTDDAAETLIGLGASAIGRTPSGFAQNVVETGAYMRAVAAGAPPIARGRAFAGDDAVRGAVIERLMCDGTVDARAIGRSMGAEVGWADAAYAKLRGLAEDGVVVLEGDRVAMTDPARRLIRLAASAFDAYLAPPSEAAPRRHAATV